MGFNYRHAPLVQHARNLIAGGELGEITHYRGFFLCDYASHPLPKLLQAGVKVSLNADDPLFFGSGLLEEYELARHTFGLDDEALASIAASSIRASGASDALKANALKGVERWLTAPAS